MDFFSLDERGNLFIAGTKKEAIEFATHCIFTASMEAIQSHGYFSLAIPGGSTPLDLFENMTKSATTRFNSKAMRFFWTDERSVSPQHPDSNYKNAMQYFSTPPWNEASFFRMKAEDSDIAKACISYESQIKKNTHEGTLDLVILGIGSDAHTASLFPYGAELKENIKLVVSSIDPVTQKKRMTLSFRAINEAKKIMVFVTGRQKSSILRDIFYGPVDHAKFPAQNIGILGTAPLYIIDFDATEKLGVQNAPQTPTKQ